MTKKSSRYLALFMALCLGVSLGLLLFLFRVPIVGIYKISPETRTLTLDGSRVLPSPEHSVKVGSHTVTLESGARSSTAFTRCGSEFELGYGEIVTIEKGIGRQRPPLCGGPCRRIRLSPSHCCRDRSTPWRSRRSRGTRRTDGRNACRSGSLSRPCCRPSWRCRGR